MISTFFISVETMVNPRLRPVFRRDAETETGVLQRRGRISHGRKRRQSILADPRLRTSAAPARSSAPPTRRATASLPDASATQEKLRQCIRRLQRDLARADKVALTEGTAPDAAADGAESWSLGLDMPSVERVIEAAEAEPARRELTDQTSNALENAGNEVHEASDEQLSTSDMAESDRL